MTVQLDQYPIFSTEDNASGFANYKTHVVYVVNRYDLHIDDQGYMVGVELRDLYIVATSIQEAREIAEKTCDVVMEIQEV